LRAISASLVIADVPASPLPRSLIFPRKTHQQTAWYSWDETLGSAWQNTILLLNAQEITEAAMESDY
jgi:hypothetical protein